MYLKRKFKGQTTNIHICILGPVHYESITSFRSIKTLRSLDLATCTRLYIDSLSASNLPSLACPYTLKELLDSGQLQANMA